MQVNSELPDSAAESYLRLQQQFMESCSGEHQSRFQLLLEDEGFATELQRVWVGSEFAAGVCRKMPEAFLSAAELDQFSQPKTAADFKEELRGQLSNEQASGERGLVQDEDELGCILRKYRNLEMLRIIWRDLNRKVDLTETTGDLSALADACIGLSLEVLHPVACRSWGEPVGQESGDVQRMVVIAMGKLGAGELNLSSDIDLIFAYPEMGETRGGKRCLSNHEFFQRLGQKLIRALDQVTAEGFVFRVDMRLRPYGQSGALVYHFDALEEYYLTQGREWERYAMIKARVVSGEEEVSQYLATVLRSFTYRKYIDFSVIQSLREMKALINREVARKGKTEDVKLGAGGIREIEFIAQAFQLIRGGRDPRFQAPQLREILQLLGSEQLLPEGRGERLWQAYRFLRNTEHTLQAWRDQQTQTLPDDREGRDRVALTMGFASWEVFSEELAEHRDIVRMTFNDVVAPEEASEGEPLSGNQQAAAVWHLALQAPTEGSSGEGIQAEVADDLVALGYSDPGQVFVLLSALQSNRGVLAMEPEARSRLDTLLPLLIADCGNLQSAEGEPGETLRRVLGIVEVVVRRSVYLALLIENPAARHQVIRLCEASPWVAGELTRYPALLDELIDPRTLYTPPEREMIADDLHQQMLRIPADDLEAQMDELRYFRRAHALRVAACEIVGALPLMKVSDYLTWLAEVILSHVLELAWQQITQRHGEPGTADGVKPDFLIVGYGKLGGLELGHGSDLDLVFIHDANPALSTDGDRPVDNETFFARLGQRIIHILSAQTAAGSLYEIDMRLRPSGNSGLLVASLAAYASYQNESAWTWEHQALVRARPVAGDEGLAERFKRLRNSVLGRRREQDALKNDVLAMREKMRAHLDSVEEKSRAGSEEGAFDLKQGAGGIVDIEFMVQFEVLAQAHSHPELTRWTDNIRLLGDLADLGLMLPQDVEILREAYKAYREVGHRRQLQQQSGRVPADLFAAERERVKKVWEHVFTTRQSGV